MEYSTSMLFFGLLLALVLLGDGKQPTGDVVAAAGILGMFLIQRIKGKATFHVPPLLNTAWAALLLYIVGRTVVSDSVGYSVSAAVRWVMAYLVFVLFSSREQEGHKGKEGEIFGHWLLGFGVVVVLASLGATTFETIGRALPGMNLLYPTFGHNHAANIIVFMFPLVLYRLIRKKNLRSSLLATFFGLALVFSFARGAWLLIFGYLWYFFFTHRMFSVRTKRIVVGGLVITGAAVFAVIFFSKNLSQQLRDWPTLRRQLVKTSAIESRLPYWKQAAAAIRERPFFGAGPGTFYLLSKRFQEAPSSYSWYAHSFPLELLAETGAIGAIGVIGLIWLVLRAVKRGPLFHSVALTLVYSMYEINLNFLVLWLLLWATIGVLYAQPSQQKKNYALSVSLLFLGVFYLFSVAAAALSLFPNTRSYTFYGEPYVAGRAVTALVDPNLSQRTLGLIEHVYKKDPEVQQALAHWYEKSGHIGLAQTAFEVAAINDPQNAVLIKEQVIFLLKHKAFTDYDAARASSSALDMVTLSKDLYFLGHAVLQTDPHGTDSYWEAASRLSPRWNYFYIERASLSMFGFGDPTGAKELLQLCTKTLNGDPFCEDLLKDLHKIPAPGSMRQEIITAR